jgi:putative nucleotidyltransferase-like protein
VNRQLSAGVLETFRNTDPADHVRRLRRFSEASWRGNFHWLDASGLALYLLQRLRALEATKAIPEAIVSQLEQRHANNQHRTAALFNECARMNSAFRNADLRYANLKGFTLVPEYCPDLSLRYQTDCDFLVDARDAAQCGEVLVGLGYAAVARNEQVIEFKTDAGYVPAIRQLYKDRPQRSVEVHLSQVDSLEFHPSLLERAATVVHEGHSYPCLSKEDMFLSQASHLFRHLRSEWTRASWLLEFRTFVARHADDHALWEAVRQRARHDANAALAVGVALRMSECVFGDAPPEALKSWCYAQLPADVALWIERYGKQVLLTDFPGSKLYLVLERAIDGGITSSQLRQRLFPRRAPQPFMAKTSRNFIAQVRAIQARSSYFFFRLRFHITAGVHYCIESWRWKRLRERAQRSDLRFRQNAASATD